MRPDLVEAFEKPRVAPPGFTDHTFKVIHDLKLGLRVWATPNATPSTPWIIWTHGGAFCGGTHYAPLTWLFPGFLARGYHVVSHAYRLAPQANISDSLEDSLDAVKWCKENLPRIVGEDKVDVERYVICGESAGGTLTTLMGHHLSPPPPVVIDVYGVVDFLDPRLLTPTSPDLPPWEGEFTEAEILAGLDDRNPANLMCDALFGNEQTKCTDEELSQRWGTQIAYTKRVRFQRETHNYISTRKHLFKLAFHPERFQTTDELLEYAASLSSYRLLDKAKSYPPTAFLHGTADEGVPIGESQKMAEKLRQMGVPVVECYEPGGPHVFDQVYSGPHVEGWDLYIQPVLDFVNQQLKFEPAVSQ